MKEPMEGTYEQMGRCLLAKSEKVLSLDMRSMFSIMAEQVAFAVGTLLAPSRSDIVAWMSPDPIYMENLHIYHVYEDESHIENV